jgi:predicted  nucleic acid-binding Zn-ribbon protein
MKTISQTRSARNIKSMRSIGARSIPKAQRSGYLELYILVSERNRLEKEIFALDKRRSAAKRQLNSVCKRIKKLQKETHEAQEIETHRGAPTKPLRTMAINY